MMKPEGGAGGRWKQTGDGCGNRGRGKEENEWTLWRQGMGAKDMEMEGNGR